MASDMEVLSVIPIDLVQNVHPVCAEGHNSVIQIELHHLSRAVLLDFGNSLDGVQNNAGLPSGFVTRLLQVRIIQEHSPG